MAHRHMATYAVRLFKQTATKSGLKCRKISSVVSSSSRFNAIPISLTSIRTVVCLQEKPIGSGNCGFANDATAQNLDLSFGDLQALVKSGDIQLIDVREPKELIEYGSYPRAVNIPLGELSDALGMPDEAFVEHYKCPKPQPHHKNIVFCAQGPIRSKAAMELAKKYSFNKTRHYRGGWEEYHAKMGLPLKKK